MIVRQALNAASARFAFSSTPRLDAELLMAHALRISRERLLLHHLDKPTPSVFAALVERRARHEPIAYITGTRAFWSIDLAVGPGVLVPRADSETLIEAALDHCTGRPPAVILDLGTGPGTLLLALLHHYPRARGLGVDRSAQALAYARANAAALNLAPRAAFMRGDWASAINARFDIVIANPPYVADTDPLPHEVRLHEPAAALFAGSDGLGAYRRIIPELPRLLAPQGAAILEIGADQAAEVAALVRAAGLGPTLRHDLADRPRAIVAT